MNNSLAAVESHYGRSDLYDTIVKALAQAGKDTSRLVPADLAPVDEFHVRGRDATVELAGRARLSPGLRVLDVGSGLGGSARYLAAEHGCQVVGVDLTREYVDVARKLADLVGLGQRVEFRQASALELPFGDAEFDVVWTEHVQMNIADKRSFYAELARVLKPGGRLVFHDIFRGPSGEPYYPVPWAETSAISAMATPDAIRDLLPTVGLTVQDWEDKTLASATWFRGVFEKAQQSGPPPLGIHLLMGNTARAKLENIHRNLTEGRIVVVQAVAEKL